MPLILAVLAAVCLCACQSFASDPRDVVLTTDRPDFTESAPVVERGVAQFESGLVVARQREDTAVTFPSSLMRIGIGHRVELRLGGDGFTWRRSAADRFTISDHELGLKVSILPETRSIPAFSIITGLSVPIGGLGLSTGGYDPEFKLVAAKRLPLDFGITTNLNFAAVTTDGTRFLQRSCSGSLSRSLALGFSGFWELYGFMPEGRGEPASVVFDSGVTHGVGRNFQFDIEAGRALRNSQTGWFVGIGLAIRHDVGNVFRTGRLLHDHR